MDAEQRKFRREPPELRKIELIEAALALISEKGVKGATVRDISARANVTQGLVRHYFSSKEDLIAATYRYHMKNMTEMTCASALKANGTAAGRLKLFIQAALTPPVMSPRAVALWASFLVHLQSDEAMKATHEQTYIEFRDHLEDLIAKALLDTGRREPARRLRHLAIACNAVIDGLWLEGGALPNAFAADELPGIGLEAVGAIIGIDLQQEVKQ